MSLYLICFVIFFPMLAGAVMRRFNAKFMVVCVLLNTLVCAYTLTLADKSPVTLLRFSDTLSVTFHVDGMTMVFGFIVSLLWPLATSYALSYTSHHFNHKCSFFRLYTATYGVTLGICFAANLLTMYIFYEALTLVTIPLVFHYRDPKSIRAAKKYTYYSMGGASFGLIAMIITYVTCHSLDFTVGGLISTLVNESEWSRLLLIYLFAFMGFGVKAAVFPFHSWLPDAGVAPTPVTALLHAVAVVKAGAFAVIRVTYYIFGTKMLFGTWVQFACMTISLVGIFYASSMSIKEPHLKRRCAYSTMSNLNYILFGCTLMTSAGFYAAMAHMITHAIMKICAFFCVGAVMHQANKHYIYDVDGLAKKMPVTFACFTISGLALAGVTGLCGFSSKWYLLNAAAVVGHVHRLAIAGVGVLLYSSLATLIYMMTVSARAYLPAKSHTDERWMEQVTDPDWRMKLPLILLCIAMVVLGLFSNPLIAWIHTIAV